MNQLATEAPRLLGTFAKELVRDRLGIKPEQFSMTADTAWISMASRLVDTTTNRPRRKVISKK